jgi:hypothetical protein
MRPTNALRIASVLTLVHCILHTIGGVLTPPQHGADEILVLETMNAHRFDFMGSMRGYGDFLLGYGLFVTVELLVGRGPLLAARRRGPDESPLAPAHPGPLRPQVRRDRGRVLEVVLHRPRGHGAADRRLPCRGSRGPEP